MSNRTTLTSGIVNQLITDLERLDEQYRLGGETASEAKVEFEQLKPLAEEARTIAIRKAKVDQSWASFCWDIPMAISVSGQVWLSLEERERWWSEGFSIAQIWQESEAEGWCLGSLANLFSEQGDYQRARVCYNQRLNIAEQLKQPLSLVKTRLNLGNLALREQDHQRARQDLLEALHNAQQFDYPREIARACGSLGILHARLSDYETATHYFEQKVNILERNDVNDEPQLLNTLTSLGPLYTDRKQFDLAEKCLRRGLVLARKLSHLHAEASLLASLAQWAEEQKNFEDALNWMQEAESLFATIPDLQAVADCQSELERIDRVRQKFSGKG